MKRTLLLALPLLLVGVLVFMLVGRSGESAPGSPAPAIVDVPATVGVEAVTAPEIQEAGEDQGQVDPGIDREPAASAGQAAVTGRIVDANTGAPVAGVALRLTGRARDRDDPEAAAVTWKNPERINTAADGAFEFRFSPPATHRFTLTVSAEDRIGMSRRWDELRPTRIDLGDLPVTAGVRVVGVVLDQNTEPAREARLRFRAATPSIAPEGFIHSTSTRAEPTAEDGSFQTPPTLLPGEWTVSLDRGDYELVGPQKLVVPEGRGSVSLQVTVRNLADEPTLSGIVVDEAGVPISGVEVTTAINSLPQFENRARSARDGSFVIRRREGDDRPVRLQQRMTSSYVMLPDDREYPWGTEDIRVVVKRPSSVRISVVEADTGRAVENYAVRIIPQDGSRLSTDSRNRTSGFHEGGRSVVEGIRAGRHVAIVFPEDAGLLPTRFEEFEVGEQGADLRMAVERHLPLTVQLVRADGTPVPGSGIQLLRKEGGEGELKFRTISGRPDEAYSRFSTSGPMGIILDEGVTDPDGEVVLDGPRSEGTLAIKALGPGHMPLLRPGIALREDSPTLTIQVAIGATLTGSATPNQVLEFLGPPVMFLTLGTGNPRETDPTFYPAIILEGMEGQGRFPQTHDGPVPIEENGSFRLEGIPPGAWTVQLRYLVQTEKGGGDGHWATHDLETITLQDGQTRSLDLELSSLIPGTISGQIFLDGEVYAQKDFSLSRVERRADGTLVGRGGLSGLVTDAEGRFAENMLPGMYRLSLVPEKADRYVRVSIPGDQLVELQSSRSVEQVFRIIRRTLRVRILESDGSPAVDRFLYSAAWNDESRTDADGWVILDPAPLDPISFSTWAKGKSRDDVSRETGQDRQEFRRRRIQLGPVQMPVGQKEAELTLRLPPDRE